MLNRIVGMDGFDVVVGEARRVMLKVGSMTIIDKLYGREVQNTADYSVPYADRYPSPKELPLIFALMHRTAHRSIFR